MEINEQVKTAYKELKNQKEEFGVFYKSVFHIHTPESHDYSLLEEWNDEVYNKKSDKDIYEIAKEKIEGLDKFTLPICEEDSKKYGYFSCKEYLSYLILANELYLQKIGCVVVCDHNSIKGIKKLETSICLLNSKYPKHVFPHVFNGVEISCADKLHVVLIFDIKKLQIVEDWLNNNIMDVESGTYETSLNVMTYFSNNGIFCYIAHINSSSIFSKDYLAGGYRQKLLQSPLIECLGVSTKDSIERINNSIFKYNKSVKVKYILDNDSHNIEGLGKNIMWIKGSKRSYEMIIEAMLNYDTSVRFQDVDNFPKNYIKGVHIPKDNQINRFLINKNEQLSYNIIFSPDLNCFIGERGTGKSTTLNILQYCLTQKVRNERELEFICRNPNIFILYELDGDEYIIEMGIRSISIKDDKEHILRKFGKNKKGLYHYSYRFDSGEIQQLARSQDLNIYHVKRNGKEFERVSNKARILGEMFDTVYSVNDLVKKADNDEMTEFIYNLLLKNKQLAKPTINGKKTKFRSISEMIVKVNNKKNQRAKQVEEIISSFNEKNIGRLKIVYEQSDKFRAPNFKNWLSKNLKNNIETYRITLNETIDCLNELYEEFGFFEFFTNIEKKKSDILGKYFCRYSTQSKLRRDIDRVVLDDNNIEKFLKIIYSAFDQVSEENLKYYINSFGRQEELRLEFNINLKVSSKKGEIIYKDIRNLSQGQKVVAMLDFILAYSDYSEDYRPLIIDQPEDNLDTRYIYLTLVNQLKSVKDKRQIIIATHNATIVTNAISDKVFVMESDGEHGWIELQGYPGEIKIKKAIVNYLEGGIDSFKHKQEIYKSVLSD